MSRDGAKPFVAIRPWLRAGLLNHISDMDGCILFLMVDHAHKDGYSYPSAELLAKNSGHKRKTIYASLKRLVTIGVLKRVEEEKKAKGRTRFRSVNRHPGPVYYWIGELDDRARERLRSMPSRKSNRGDAARFKMSQSQAHLTKAKMFQSQEHLEPERCPIQSPKDVPDGSLKDVPDDGPKMSHPQAHEESFKSKKPRVFKESSPIPSLGGCPIPEQVRARTTSPSPSSQKLGKDEKITTRGRMEKNEEALRLRMESDHTLEGGVKKLDTYFAWYSKLAKDYPPEMIRRVYEEVIRKIKGGNHG